MSEVNITELSNKVVIDDATNVVEISSPGPQGTSGSSFAPAADSGTGSSVTSELTIAGGTNITTAVSGTTVTVNASGGGTVTSVTPQGDNGSGTAITGSGNIKVAGTAPISTTVVGDTITVTHDTKAGTGTSTNYPGSIEVDSFGHVLGVGTTSTPATAANNLSDLANVGTARTNLGLGTAAVEDAGTGPNDIVQLDGSSRLPAVDGSQLTNLPAATSMPASGLTSGSLSIDLIPNADGTLDLGSADYRWAEIHGDLEGSVMFRAKNGNASALSVGDVVYISGYTSGATPDVDLADADDAAKMPSFGVISTGGNSGAEVYVTTLGTLDGLDLPPATYSAGDEIFVSTTAGDFTKTAPTGESAAIQKIGFVIKANTGGGTNGSIKVLGAGRSNATPNLDSGKIFYGNGSNQAVSTTLTSVAEAAGAVSTHAAVTSGVHGISSFGATLVDDADAATARTTLGATTVGANVFTAADQAAARSAIGVGTGTGDVVAANNLSDLADAATARTNLGLGSSSTLDVPSSGDAASGEVVKGNDTRLTDARTPVAHSAALITSGTLAIAQGGTGSATAPMVGVITAADAAAARTVLSLGTAATSATGDFEAAGSIATHNAITTAHGISAFGATLVDDADAAAARTTLSLGTAATSATGDFEAAGSISTHNAITTAHGISTFGSTLVDDADAAAARTTLGAAASNHTHTLANITDSGTAAALDVGITGNDVLQVSPSGVANSEFLRVEAFGTTVTSRTAAEVLSDIGADNASNLTSGTIPTARIDTGTTAGKIVVLDGSARLPAVDGSLLTNVGGSSGPVTLAYTGHLEAPVEKTYYLSPYTPAAQTATGLYAICDTGTCTVEFKSNGVSLGSINVTASTSTQATPSSTTIPASEDVIMVVTSVSACFNLRFALEYTQ